MRNNEVEKKFQADALLDPCPVSRAIVTKDVAEKIALELGYRDEDITILVNKSKQEIGEALKALKQEAASAEQDANKKAQAFLIMNIGHMLNPVSHKDLMQELGQSYTSDFNKTEYFRDYQLSAQGEVYNLAEAAAWITHSDNVVNENTSQKSNVIVLNHFSGHPVLFKQHIKNNGDMAKLKADFDELEGVKWLLDDNQKDSLSTWKRESRQCVTYAREVNLEEVLACIVFEKKKENFVIIFPEIENDIEESGCSFLRGENWADIRSTIFDLRSKQLYQKHTRNIAYKTFNDKENLWGGLQALPSLQHCTTTYGDAKFHCSVDKIELANQLVYLSAEKEDENSQEKIVLDFFEIDKVAGTYTKTNKRLRLDRTQATHAYVAKEIK